MPFLWCICSRVKACLMPSQWPTVTTEAFSVGHGNDVAPALVWSPSSRPKKLLKKCSILLPSQDTAYAYCEVSARLYRWRDSRLLQPSGTDVIVCCQTLAIGRKWISVNITLHTYLKKVNPFNSLVRHRKRGQLYKCAFDFSCVILPDL